MEVFSIVLALAALALEATLLWRGKRRRVLGQFPLFFSYIAYTFIWSAGTLVVYWVWPQHYASVFWYFFLLKLVVEFAVVVEISDQMFRPYPAVALLGRLVSLTLATALFALYILPALLNTRAEGLTLLDLIKRTSLAKVLIIVALLAAARSYGLTLGRNVAGLMLGLAFHLALNVANFALAEFYGRAMYGSVFAVLGPLSYVMAMAIWTQAMWDYEPARVAAPARPDIASDNLDTHLGRFDSALARLFRR
jgi:hypothetical protein